MRAPSAESLMKTFRIERKDANRIRLAAKAVDNPDALRKVIEDHFPATQEWVFSLHSSPYDSKIWRVTTALNAMDEALGSSGVEGLGPPRSGDYAPPYEYLNMGDPYVATLIYRRRTDTLSIGNWGAIVEAHPSWE